MQHILLVEDNEDDIFFMQHAKSKAGIRNPMDIVQDGGEAIDYLSGNGKYANCAEYPLPFLVLLDLKLPTRPGLDVLKWIREQPELETIIVVVLTSSKEERDIDRAYRLGANSYLVKPPSADKLLELVRSLGEYWFRHNEPPVVTH